MYPSLDNILMQLGEHRDTADNNRYWPQTDREEPSNTVRFTGRFISTGDEYLLAVNGIAYPVTLGPDLAEGQPESIEDRDVQVVVEIEPGEEIFANELQPIHIIEIIP